MPRTSDKRGNLIQAADTLFHQRGFERSTIADVAAAASVPIGNVYYYFRTKDDLITAVTRFRNEASLRRLEDLDRLGSARERLEGFVGRFDGLVESRAAHGCPTGGLCLETNKIGGVVAEQAALAFRQSLGWLSRQFAELGRKPAQARDDAARIMGGIQGAILLTNTFKDPDFMLNETKRLKEWLRTLPAPAHAASKAKAAAAKTTAKKTSEKTSKKKGKKK